MKKALVILTLFAFSTPAFAKKPKSPFTEKLQLNYMSKQFVRGFIFSDEPVLQPGYTFGYKGLKLFFTGNYRLRQEHLSQLMFILSYGNKVKDWKYSVSYAFLHILHGPVDYTQEVSASVTYARFLHPKLSFTYDFGTGTGSYTELSLNPNARLTKWLSVSAKAALGYNHEYYQDASGFSHAHLQLDAALIVTSWLKIVPTVRYSQAISKNFKTVVYGGVNTVFNL